MKEYIERPDDIKLFLVQGVVAVGDIRESFNVRISQEWRQP